MVQSGVDISKFRFNKNNRANLRKKYSIPQSTFVFLYLGRINKDKGIIELINAFNDIKNKKNIILIFVGQVEDQKIKNLFKKDNQILYFNLLTLLSVGFQLLIFCVYLVIVKVLEQLLSKRHPVEFLTLLKYIWFKRFND